MKKYIYIILGLLILSLGSCNDAANIPGQEHNTSNKVILTVKALKAVTRTVADTDPEATLAWVDVYIMNEEDSTIWHRERIDKSLSPVAHSGQFALKKKRDEFALNKKYFIYVIANATAPLNEEARNWKDLCKLVQTDENLHLSGFNIAIMEGKAPKYFLMDGYAYVGEDPGKMTACVIRNSADDETELSGTLYRAAAKIILNITQGNNVKFQKELEANFPLYSLYQLPISTLVVAPEVTSTYKSVKQTTVEHGMDDGPTKPFYWTDTDKGPKITFIAYAYANDWSGKKVENESSLLLSIPMLWDKENDGTIDTPSPVNWYKIPLSKESRFERNKCYMINLTINAIGAEDKNEPIELKDIEYVTLDWQDVKVGLGNNEARYLTLNTDVVKIYNKNFDLDQLTFTSSSPIKSIKLKDVFSHNESSGTFSVSEVTKESDGTTEPEYEEADGVYAYYIDKFGQKIQLGTDPEFDIKLTDAGYEAYTKEQILALESNLYQKADVDTQYIHCELPAEQKRALNGNIHIYTPIYPIEGNEDLNWNSHFNTVRYLEFEVMNEQGLTATFRVEQSPVTIISNKEGFFSYRDDFRIGNAQLYHNPDAFPNAHGKKRPVDNGPIHYLNPGEPFFMTAGFLPYHEHECDENGVLLISCTNAPTEGYEELLYGGIERVYHRTYSFGGPVESVFHRDHYVTVNGNILGGQYNNPTDVSHYYQALGMMYAVETTNSDGVTTKKYYRRHYTGNFFETFWSKYVMKVYTEDGTNMDGKARVKGQADIVRQMGNEAHNGWEIFTSYGYNVAYNNHRMYHVRATSTSSEYTIAFPRLMDENGMPTTDRSRGYTMEGTDNSKIVSPSFMVASQLGETTMPRNEYNYVVPGVEGIYYYAKRQCQEYVEARYDDLNGNHKYDAGLKEEGGEPVYHYNDWRLPTKAEIDYIIEHQNSSRAMDMVMRAQYYYVASVVAGVYNENTLISSEVPNYNTNYTGYYMRCVRDVYKEPEPVYYNK